MAQRDVDRLFREIAKHADFGLFATPLSDLLRRLPPEVQHKLRRLESQLPTVGALFLPTQESGSFAHRRVWQVIEERLLELVAERAPEPPKGRPDLLPAPFARVKDARAWFDAQGLGWAFEAPVAIDSYRHGRLRDALAPRQGAAVTRPEARRRLALWIAQVDAWEAHTRQRSTLPFPEEVAEVAARWSDWRGTSRPLPWAPVRLTTTSSSELHLSFSKELPCRCRARPEFRFTAEALITEHGATCPVRSAAIAWALELVRGTFGPEYAEVLSRPAWMGLLNGFVVDVWEPLAPPGQVTWMLYGQHRWISAVVPTCDGGPLPSEAPLHELEPRDRLLVRFRRGFGISSQVVVNELVGHPHVEHVDVGAVSVRRAQPRLFLFADQGHLKAVVRLGSLSLSEAELRREPPWAYLDAERRVVWASDPQQGVLKNLTRVLELLKHELPVSARDLLLERITFGAPDLPVDIDPELLGPEEQAEPRPVLQVSRTEEGVSATLIARPLPGGRTFAPGQGADRVVRASPAAWAWRDRKTEVALARRAASALGLATYPDDFGPWSFQRMGPLAAVLRAAEALPELAGVSWDGPSRKVKRLTGKQLRVRVEPGRDWLRIGGNAEVDGALIALEALLDAVRVGDSALLVDGAVVEIEDDLAAHLTEVALVSEAGGIAPLAVESVTGLEDVGASVTAPREWLDAFERARAAERLDPDLPTGLRAELRPYQLQGFRWLARLAEWAPGCLLCDDMGLGKTLQAITLLMRRASGPALVVAPTSVLFNWRAELERFAPGLQISLHQGSDRDRALDVGPAGVVLTSWDLLIRDAELLAAIRWHTVVFDEAQAAKNPDSKRARTARALDASFRLVLTGTPLENRLSDLWSLCALGVPGLLGPWERFRARFGVPISQGDAAARERLKRLLSRFLLRRTKREVAPDLPERTEVVERISLSRSERTTYDRERLRALLGSHASELPEQQHRIQMLAALTRLRQLACDPALVVPEQDGTSSKIARLAELVEELVGEDRQALVFSSFVRLLDRAEQALTQVGARVLRLDGATPPRDRQALVERFQAGEADVFLISLKAGGTGLNLTAADTVILLDPWWNPAAEAQAADRAHRIGQSRAVTIHKLVSEGTVEEGVLEMQEEKRALVSSVLDDATDPRPVSLEELRALFALGEDALEERATGPRHATTPTPAPL